MHDLVAGDVHLETRETAPAPPLKPGELGPGYLPMGCRDPRAEKPLCPVAPGGRLSLDGLPCSSTPRPPRSPHSSPGGFQTGGRGGEGTLFLDLHPTCPVKGQELCFVGVWAPDGWWELCSQVHVWVTSSPLSGQRASCSCLPDPVRPQGHGQPSRRQFFLGTSPRRSGEQPSGPGKTVVLLNTFLMSFSCLFPFPGVFSGLRQAVPAFSGPLSVCMGVRGGRRRTVSDKGPIGEQEVALGLVLQSWGVLVALLL